MAIQKTKQTKEQSTTNAVKVQINNLLKEPLLKEMPKELRNKLNFLIEEINEMTFTNTNAQLINGEISNKEKILELIIEASENKNWKFDSTTILKNKELIEIKNMYGVDFEENEIEEHLFYQKTKGRDSVSTIVVVALPGYFNVQFQTEKVGYFIDNLLTLKELSKTIRSECN